MTIDINALKSAGWQGSSVPSGATSYTKNSDGSFTFKINGKDVKYNASGSVFEASAQSDNKSPAGIIPFNIGTTSIWGGGFGSQIDTGAFSYLPQMQTMSSQNSAYAMFSNFMSSMIQSLSNLNFNIPFISNKGRSQQVDGVTGASIPVTGSNNNPTGVLSSDKQKWGVTQQTLPDGTKILGCRWTKFSKSQPEWLGKQKYMQQAAKELGLTIVYSDMERTVAASNAGRAKKGSLVARGGQSPHNYGVAADIVLYKNGKAIGVDSALQTQFAQRVKELSGGTITWGGDWNKKGERHHFELTGWQQKYKSSRYLVG